MNAKEKLNYLVELNRSDKNRFDFEIYTVCGDKNKKLRSEIMQILTGEKYPDKQCTFSRIKFHIQNVQTSLF